MKCKLNSCCWITSVRTGTIIVGWMFVLLSFLYMVGFLLRLGMMKKGPSVDICQNLINKYNDWLSLAGATLGLAIGVVVLIAMYSENPFFLAIGIGLLLLNTVIYFFFAFWLIQCFALFISLLVASGIYLYIFALFASNYFDMSRQSMYIIEESPRPSLEPPFRYI